jgi:hypothetical protein
LETNLLGALILHRRAVVIHKPEGATSWLDWEILEAERTSGAPDCLGKWQGKWGTYTKPTDHTAEHAVKRGLAEYFGEGLGNRGRLSFVAIVGPWLHKAKMYLDRYEPVLEVLKDQGEQTPFQATLFVFEANFKEVDISGGHSKSTKDLRWVTLRSLIHKQGDNPDYLYWQMIGLCLGHLIDGPVGNPVRYYEPRKYYLTDAGYKRVKSEGDYNDFISAT